MSSNLTLSANEINDLQHNKAAVPGGFFCLWWGLFFQAMKRILFFSNSPDLNASLRFFVNVPVFLLLASALLGWWGSKALTSRWAPEALALTHLLTLGVLASAMIGALLQILPVTTGIYIARTRLTATVVHLTLTAGTLLLAASFLTYNTAIAWLALGFLVAAFGWLLIAVAIGLWKHYRNRTLGSEPLRRAVSLALLALIVTVGLGMTLLAARITESGSFRTSVTDMHGAWGLLGWVALLLGGVTFKVIPVFQATELYPRIVMRWLAPTGFVLLMIWSGAVLLDASLPVWAEPVSAVLIGVLWCAYAVLSLKLLSSRKRSQPDATTRFWHVAMGCFAACLPVWLWWRVGHQPSTAFMLGLLMIVGVAVTAINGMLYKILPVLLWNHAQMPLKRALPQVPKVKDILPDRIATPQFWAHLPALALLVLASLWPVAFTRLAALALAISALWLARNMVYAVRTYNRAQAQIRHALQSQQDERSEGGR